MKKNDVKKMIYCNSENWDKMKKTLFLADVTITDFFSELIEKTSSDSEFLKNIIDKLKQK